jgi:phospholipase/lecithinase/hemolysin
MIILRIVFITIIMLSIGSVPTNANPSFSKVVVFGDSNVDSGEAQEGSLYNLSGGILNGPPNVGGRNCNGPVVVEYVADMLGVPLVDYGVSGARTGLTNLVYDFVAIPGVQYTGVLSQINMFKESLGNKKADSQALYVYWGGSNDLFGATADNLLERVNTALDNIKTALTILTDLGARYILVATRTIRPEYYDENNVNGVVFNGRLRTLVQRLNEELKANIQIFEAFDLITDMTYNPEAYGFVETTDLCISIPACVDNPNVSDTYITWDAAHKTTRTHEVMAYELVFQAQNIRKGKGLGVHSIK